MWQVRQKMPGDVLQYNSLRKEHAALREIMPAHLKAPARRAQTACGCL